MPIDRPQTYHSFKPFRALFETGLPILTWHKLGPRPRGARLKGLYMPARLFARQLAELSAAGFRAISLHDLKNTARARSVVLTFDDGYQNVLTHGLESLTNAGFQAIQFLVADRLGQHNDWDSASGEVQERLMDTEQVQLWLAAGQQIGSHTSTHPWLTKLPLSQAREEITSSKKRLEDLFGIPVQHFCYPYGDWSPAVRNLVAEAGYHSACTTEFGVNSPATDPFALKRITARYRSRSLKSIKAWFSHVPPGAKG